MVSDAFEHDMREQISDLPILALFRPGNDMLVAQLEPGETIPRKVKKSYFTIVESRTKPVNLTYAAELQQMVVRRCREHTEVSGKSPVLLLLAYEHLANAMHDELDRVVREQHFDIAGSCIWQYAAQMTSSATSRAFLDRYLAIFRRAGGV